jgi:hypothetical protein
MLRRAGSANVESPCAGELLLRELWSSHRRSSDWRWSSDRRRHYFIHRGHTSLSGCVQQTDAGLRLIAKDGNSYELVNAPIGVKPLKRFSLRGHKANSPSGHTFRVDHVSHDYGTCSP